MRSSGTIGAIALALSKAQAKFPPIVKNKTATVTSRRTGGTFTYNYADWSDILDKVRPCLNEQEIAILQPTDHVDGVTHISTYLAHSSGEWMQSDGLPLPPPSEDDQSLGIHMKYRERYDGCALLGISPEEDMDALASKAKKKPERPAAQVPGAPTTEERTEFSKKLKHFHKYVTEGQLRNFVLKVSNAPATRPLTKDEWVAVLKALETAESFGSNGVRDLVEHGGA